MKRKVSFTANEKTRKAVEALQAKNTPSPNETTVILTHSDSSSRIETKENDANQLSKLEERFLRAVSLNNTDEVTRCLKEDVNIHVQNGFER
jgi:C4-type Zn-finger protein